MRAHVCAYLHVCEHICELVCIHLCTDMEKPEVDVSHLVHSFSTSYTEAGSLS